MDEDIEQDVCLEVTQQIDHLIDKTINRILEEE